MSFTVFVSFPSQLYYFLSMTYAIGWFTFLDYPFFLSLVQAFGFEADSDNSSSFVTTFDAADAEDASKFLRKAFNILQPGNHASKRMPEMDGGYFSHCPRYLCFFFLVYSS